MGQLTGRAQITVNGVTFNSKKGASFDPGGVTRKTQTSDSRSDYTEELRPAMVKCEVQWGGDISVTELNDIKDATVQFAADTGALFVLSNAWRVDALEAKAADDGGIPLEFHANDSEEVRGA